MAEDSQIRRLRKRSIVEVEPDVETSPVHKRATKSEERDSEVAKRSVIDNGHESDRIEAPQRDEQSVEKSAEPFEDNGESDLEKTEEDNGNVDEASRQTEADEKQTKVSTKKPGNGDIQGETADIETVNTGGRDTESDGNKTAQGAKSENTADIRSVENVDQSDTPQAAAEGGIPQTTAEKDVEKPVETIPSTKAAESKAESKSEETRIDAKVSDQSDNSESSAEDSKTSENKEDKNAENAENNLAAYDEISTVSEPAGKETTNDETSSKGTATGDSETPSTFAKSTFGSFGSYKFGSYASSSFGSFGGSKDNSSSVFGTFKRTTQPSASENPWAEPELQQPEPKPSIFGSNKKEDNDDSEEEEETNNDHDEPNDLYVQLDAPLEARKVETGEEAEQSVFSCRAKLYALDLTAANDGWKERGVGQVHVNVGTKEDGKTTARIVMRSDGVLRVILNQAITKTTEVLNGMKSSLASEKFVRLTGFEGETPYQYALKTGSSDLAISLFENLKSVLPE